MSDAVPGRKYFLDNLRAFTVLLLFPYHTFMIYNTNGESWYIHGADLAAPTFFLDVNWGWMMPLLFAVAGISTAYALKKRSMGEYAKERIGKLLLPLVFGILLVIPIQSFIAGVVFQGEVNYLNFFTKLTDLTGYDGAFTPGQLWFILYLFLISMASIPILLLCKAHLKKPFAGKIPLMVVILLGLLPTLMKPVLNIGGKSFGEYLAYFLLGYLILSDEEMLAKLDRYRFPLLALMVGGVAETLLTRGFLREFFSWVGVLALLGMGRHYLNFGNRLTAYLSKSSFGVYIFHQSWIVITAYWVLPLIDNAWLQIGLILLVSIALTFLTYEGARRVPAFRRMFGFKR